MMQGEVQYQEDTPAPGEAAGPAATSSSLSRLTALAKAAGWIAGAGLAVTAINGVLPIASGWTRQALIGLGLGFVAYAGWRAWRNLASLSGADNINPSHLTANVDSVGNILGTNSSRD